MTDRRQFLRIAATGAAALAATSRSLSALAKDDRYRADIGIQLYTLRNEIGKDADATIEAVVEAGYKQGEMYGFPDCGPMIAAAREHGLALRSSHFQWESVTDPKDDALSDFSRILDKAEEVGLKHLVIPYLHGKNRETLDDYRRVADRCNAAAAKAKAAGIQLSYHNHSFEFEPKGDSCGFDVFVERFAPEMQFELDVFWVKAGGVEPVALMEKLGGRVSQLHLKDLKEGIELPKYGGMPADGFQELGDGIIPMEPIIEAAASAGVQHCHVEQDQSPDPIASIRQSMEYLRGL